MLQVGHQRKGTLRLYQLIRKVRRSRKASSFVASCGVVALGSMLLVGNTPTRNFQPAASGRALRSSATACASCTTFKGATGYAVPIRPKTRIHVAAQASVHHTPAGSSSQLRQPIAVGTTTVTSPVQSTPVAQPPSPKPQSGPGVNVFPYGTCTWWADQRYYQLHGVFVPWHTQANAWQWTARAYQYGWHVSSTPVLGAIVDLQPGVQGASGLGHVAVVERILSNGHVIASNMSWGANPSQVTDVEFAPGPGVTFIYQ